MEGEGGRAKESEGQGDIYVEREGDGRRVRETEE